QQQRSLGGRIELVLRLVVLRGGGGRATEVFEEAVGNACIQVLRIGRDVRLLRPARGVSFLRELNEVGIDLRHERGRFEFRRRRDPFGAAAGGEQAGRGQ